MLEGVIAEELLLPATVAPTLFDLELFPSAAVTLFGTGGIAPAFYIDSDVVYSPIINAFDLAPQSVVIDTDTIFDFTSSHVDAIVPALFQSDDAFYEARIPAALGLQLLVDVDRFYGAQTAFSLTSAAVASDDNIRAQIVQHGTTWRTLSASFVDADLFIRPDVSWPVVSAAFIDADVFYAPDQTNYLRPGALASTDAIFSAGLGQPLRPGFIADTEQFFGPSIPAPIAPVTLATGLVVDSDSLISPIVFIAGGLVTALYSDTDVFFSPSVTLAPLAPALFSEADSFFGPSIRMFLLPVLLSDSETIAAPAIAIVDNPPTFVNAVATTGNTAGTSGSPTLVTSRTTGNLLIALIQVQAGPKTFSVGGGWTIGGTQADTTMSSAWAWRYVDGSEAAPTFSWTTSNAWHAKMLQFHNVASTSAPGAFASTSGTGTAVSQGGITTTLDESMVMALLFARTQQTSVAGIGLGSYSVVGTPFSDSFLTDIEGQTTVAASGGVSPTLSTTLTVSSVWHTHLVEIKRL
jgi:2-hydroxychromene-2-carboxylate isomerase